jgi:hypothetical protein
MACGALPDGCGGTVTCACIAPETCGGGGTSGLCGCAARTCKEAGAGCGSISDGCGLTLDCGACLPHFTCGLDAPSQCACHPKSCMDLGSCGSFDDGCGGPLACPCSLVEEFLSTALIDAAATTALIDTAPPGYARSQAALPMEASAGTGKDGKFAPTGGGVLVAGSFDYSEVVLAGPNTNAKLQYTVPGDLTLRVAGGFSATGNVQVIVQGDLTIIAGGPVVIDCSFIYANGRVRVHQLSGDGIDLGCENPAIGEADLASLHPTRPSGVQLWTRGGVRFGRDSYLLGGEFGDTGGDLEIRAYGDVIANHAAYLIAGEDVPNNGSLSIWTEGAIRVLDNSYLLAGHGYGAALKGGDMRLHAVGPIDVRGASYVISNSPGDIEVWSESDVTLADQSNLLLQRNPPNSPKLSVRGKSLTLSNGSYLLGNAGEKGAGTLAVEVTGDVRLVGGVNGGSGIDAANGVCARPGAGVSVSAGGSVSVDVDSEIVGGAGGCDGMLAQGGNATVVAGGAISLAGDPLLRVRAGTGDPAGVRTVTQNTPPALAPLDAGLLRRTSAQSTEQTLAGLGPQSTVASVESSPVLAPGQGAVLFSPARGQPFAPLADAVGKPLGAGLRYRVDLTGRMFDAPALDRLKVVPMQRALRGLRSALLTLVQ